MLDEVLLILFEVLPVLDILTEINLVNSPEAGHLILVHLPDIMILDGQDNKAIGVLLKQWLR